MKCEVHALYLAYHFPPKEGIACVRTTNTARHLSRLGWKVTVVTPKEGLWSRKDDGAYSDKQFNSEGIDIIRTNYAFKCLEYTFLNESGINGLGRFIAMKVRKLIKRINPVYELCWTPYLRSIYSRLEAIQFDIILASGAPWSSFASAGELSKRTGRPYVLDYRDMWTANSPYGGRRPGREQQIEASLVGLSSGITVVSEGMRDGLVGRFGSCDKIQVVPNGFNPDEFLDVEPMRLKGRAIVYTGTLATPKRVLDPVFKAFRELKNNAVIDRLGLRFYYFGPNDNLVREAAKKFDVMEMVEIMGNRPRREALAAIKVGSSRVDLQACKLEYSIVSPK